MEIAPGIDGTVINANIEKHADHAKRHLNVTEMWQDEDRLILQAETTTSGVNIRVIARDRLEGGMPGPMMIAGDRMSRPVTARLGRGQRLRIDRTLTICTGDGERPSQVPDHDRLREAHADAWQRVWQRMPLSVQGEDHPLSVVRFHLLQNWSPLSLGRDAGFPARGWQEAYRGQIFWDGMFATFVYAWRFPDLAREALMYRHRRLGAARSKAQERGLRGALYPWRSARSGDEATPRFQKFMTSGHWHVDHTHLQAHINSAIAHDIFQYGWISGDRDFLHGEGLEMLVEIARLWDSLAMHDPAEDRFDIAGIIGPDEFHTHAPGRETPGLKNNAYTNLTAVWTLIHLIALLEEVPPARRAALGVTGKEVAAWDRLSRRMRIAFRPDGLISQFEGVEALRPLDPAPFGSANVQWELEAQGADVNDHAIFKQADMGMLLYLFTPAEVVSLLARLGYVVPEADLFRALTFYRDRSSHNSSLSEVGYAAGLARFDPALSWKIWRTSVRADLDAEHAGGTGDGLHLGAGAASIDVLQRVFMGLRADADGLQIAPAQPDGLGPASFGFRFHGGDYAMDWDGRHQHLSANADNTRPLSFRYHARTLSVQPGERVRLE